MHCWRGWPAGENAVPSSLPDRLQIPASLPRRHRHHRPGARLRVRERKWCRHANRWGASRWARGYFAAISRLGDGVFWYLLMGALVLWDGPAGLAASAHMAATGAAALLLYKGLKCWTRRRRPFAADGRIQAWVAPLDENTGQATVYAPMDVGFPADGVLARTRDDETWAVAELDFGQLEASRAGAQVANDRDWPGQLAPALSRARLARYQAVGD